MTRFERILGIAGDGARARGGWTGPGLTAHLTSRTNPGRTTHVTGRAALVGLAALIGFAVAVVTYAEEPSAETTAPQAAASPTRTSPAPMSVTTMGSAELQDRGIVSLAGIAAATPDITSAPTLSSQNTLILFMRGQGLDNPVQITRDGGIGIYQDGFPIVRAQALTFDLGELESVEILRGPQGAVYGRDTTGGVINLISKAPAGELRFRQTVDFGNRNSFRILSALDAPTWHGLSAKVTVLASSIDGYVKNVATTSHDYGEEKQRGGRLQLRWDPFASLQVDYFLEKNNLDSTAAYDTDPALNGTSIYFSIPYYANPNGPMSKTYRGINLPLSTSTHTAHGLTLAWQAMPALTIKSLTGFRTLEADAKQDYAEFANLPETTDDLYRHKQFSQELQFTGDVLDQQLGYAAGVSYYKEYGAHDRVIYVPTSFFTFKTLISAHSHSDSAYARLIWRPNFAGKRLELTAAARYTRDIKDAERSVSDNSGSLENGAINHFSYRRVNPEFTVDYRWTDSISTYARLATAYRAGGALETAPIDQFATSTFRPESLGTVEVGTRLSLLGERLRVNAAVFQSRYRDIEFAIPVDPATDEPYPLQKATIRGVDLELVASPFRDLTVNTRVDYLNSRIDRVDVLAGTVFDNATNSKSPYVVGGNIRQLFALPYAPKYNFTVGADYTFLRGYSGDFSARLDYVYRARFFTDAAAGSAVPGNQFDSVPALGLLNARLTWSGETDWSHRIRFSLWGKNVLNRRYYQFATGVGSGVGAFGSSGVPVGYTARAGAWAQPATYGIDVRYEY